MTRESWEREFWKSQACDNDFWVSRSSLCHIRRTAQARLGGPWGTLGVSMVRALATVPPKVQLQPVTGGPGSLNLCIALVGASGQGKGVAESIAKHAVQFRDKNGNDVVPTGVPIGSGEGIARTFRPAGSDEMTSTTAIFTAHEVDTLTGLSGRSGSTLAAELRKLFSGEPLGFANANAATRCLVEAHTYRAGVILGVQPLRSGSLLAAADGGLPQRFLWLPVSDVDAPEMEPVPPMPLERLVSDWGQSSGPVILGLPDEAVAEIAEHRRRVLREDPDVDPLDGHALFVREKVAAALAVLDGRRHITSQDWWLSGYVMNVSARQREICQQALREKSRQIRRERALDTAEHDRMVSDSKFSRAKRALTKRLDQLRSDEVIARKDLRGGLRSEVRPDFDAAINELVLEGKVFEVQTERGTGYTTSTPSTPVHRTRPADSWGGQGWTPSTPTPPSTASRPGKTPQSHGDSQEPARVGRNDSPHNDSHAQQTNGAEVTSIFGDQPCSGGCGRPAGRQGWCRECGEAYGLNYSKQESAQ